MTQLTAPRAGASMQRRQWTVIVVLSLGQFMSILDTTAVNVSLPSIEHDLHISAASLSWVMNAYLVAFGAFLLVAGRLGDLVGRKQVFLAGLGLFTGASLLCGLSDASAMLVAARFVQGVGAAVETAMILGIIAAMLPQRSQRDRAIGVYAFLGAAGGCIGLLMGGVITAALSWHWIFFLNIPVGLLALGVGAAVIDRHQGLGVRQGVDIAGGVLVTASAMLAVGGFVEAGNRGWSSSTVVGMLGGAAVLAAAFVVVESRKANPLIPLAVLRVRNLACAGVARAMFCFGSYGSFFLLVLYLQQVLGYGALGNGLAFLPNSVFLSILALVAAPVLIRRLGSRLTHLLGLGAFAVGIGLLVAVPVGGRFWVDVFPSMVVLGVAAGTYTVPNVAIAMAESGVEDTGLVSGVINVAQQIGAALGIAVVASVSDLRTQALRRAGVGAKPALVDGYHLGFVFALGALAVAVVAAALVRSAPAVTSAEVVTDGVRAMPSV